MKIAAMHIVRPLVLAASVVFVGCGGHQSAVSPAGTQSEHLSYLWWAFFYVTAAVYLIVMAVLAIAFFRRRTAANETAPETSSRTRDARAENTIKAAVGVTVVILFVLLFFSFRTGKAINSLSDTSPSLAIKVTGHQWWWEVEYQAPSPSDMVTTANEIHIPVGRTVRLALQSTDVIHS